MKMTKVLLSVSSPLGIQIVPMHTAYSPYLKVLSLLMPY